jgi:hypothetical protein
MLHKKIQWLIKCVGFCLLGIFLLNMIGRTVTPLLSWCLYHDNPSPIIRNTFAMRHYLSLTAFYGFLLGLIPLHQVNEAFSSYFTNFRSKFSSDSRRELQFADPVLWAWLPIGIVFLIRLVTWKPADQSVIEVSAPGRLEHFFFTPDAANLNLFASATQQWVFDRYALLGPTVFLLAYPLGVWLTRQFPSRPNPSTTS